VFKCKDEPLARAQFNAKSINTLRALYAFVCRGVGGRCLRLSSV
jgi:hypothetical protein